MLTSLCLEPVFGAMNPIDIDEDFPMGSSFADIPVTDQDGIPETLTISIVSQEPELPAFAVANLTLYTPINETLDAESLQNFALHLRYSYLL